MVFIYTALLFSALFYVIKILWPEMSSVSPSKPESRPVSADKPEAAESANRLEKLESLLIEKNKNINLLQNELKIFHSQVRHFDKVKILMEAEIQRLKEQNRIFRSELGIPPVASSAESKVNSIT